VDSAFDYAAHQFMSWNDGELARAQVSVHYMQVGPAHAARMNPNEYFVWSRCSDRQALSLQRLAPRREHHRVHGPHRTISFAEATQKYGSTILRPTTFAAVTARRIARLAGESSPCGPNVCMT
jgi:hypothetical protein